MAISAEHHVLSRRAPRALVLLTRLVDLEYCGRDVIARALVVSEATLAAYIDESESIPLDRQLSLALFVIGGVPPLARLGHQLRGQVAAAMAFRDRTTETHRQPPPSNHL